MKNNHFYYYKQSLKKNQSIVLKSQGIYPFFDFKLTSNGLILRVSGIGKVQGSKKKERVEIYFIFKNYNEFLKWWDSLDVLLKSVEETFSFLCRKEGGKVEEKVEKGVEKDGEKN